MGKLQVLSIGSNKIEGSLPRLHFPHLQYLTIQGNQITDIANLPDSNVKALVLLKMNRTSISKIPRMDLPKLEFIKANNCKISNIDEFVQSRLPLLNKLNL